AVEEGALPIDADESLGFHEAEEVILLAGKLRRREGDVAFVLIEVGLAVEQEGRVLAELDLAFFGAVANHAQLQEIAGGPGAVELDGAEALDGVGDAAGLFAGAGLEGERSLG